MTSKRKHSPYQITIQVQDVHWKTALRPYRKTVREACKMTLSSSPRRGEITIVLANDAFIRELNRDFRSKDKSTNVLSFMGEGEHLGDIVLALETIKREAQEQGKPFKAHTQHLLVHGVLHLLGHDHMKPKDAKKMEMLEIKILKKLQVSNPYL
jgi:probable rRNA maturation factor